MVPNLAAPSGAMNTTSVPLNVTNHAGRLYIISAEVSKFSRRNLVLLTNAAISSGEAIAKLI